MIHRRHVEGPIRYAADGLRGRRRGHHDGRSRRVGLLEPTLARPRHKSLSVGREVLVLSAQRLG